MGEAIRLIVLILLGAGVLTVGAMVLAWWMEPGRRLQRAMLKSLGRPPQAEAWAPHEGRGAGIDFDQGHLAVLWNNGAHGLIYGVQEIDGAEVIVDGAVIARVSRAAPRRDMDILAPDASQVTLRLMFADPRDPEFELTLYDAQLPVIPQRPGLTSGEALRLARRWLSHVEALIKV